MHCIGCGKRINWDGRGLFSCVCPCYSTTFIDGATGKRFLASRISVQMTMGAPVNHLNDIVGDSDYSSKEKTAFVSELREIGFIWMRECERCREDGTLKKRQERARRRMGGW